MHQCQSEFNIHTYILMTAAFQHDCLIEYTNVETMQRNWKIYLVYEKIKSERDGNTQKDNAFLSFP